MKFALLLAAALLPAVCRADDTPPWLKEAASRETPRYAAGAAALVLLDEESLAIDETGRMSTVHRQAVRILTGTGRSSAIARQVYIAGTGKIHDMRAWLIPPSGSVKRYQKDKVVDVALVQNDIYNEVRAKLIAASDDAAPGSVFGYECSAEDRAMFPQTEWAFQDRLPVLQSRYSVTLPAAWQIKTASFNIESYGDAAPQVAGPTRTWELRDLHAIPQETRAPALSSLAPRIMLSLLPPGGAAAGARAFETWQDVARWLAELNDPQAAATDAIREKARSLTAGLNGELDKIQAIGRFVQGIPYVSIQTGVGRGGGYRPHAAATVLEKNYGDCKDKANLMRALLKGIGMDAYPIAIFSGDRLYVQAEFPSPQQFNHMIVAVQVTAATEAPSILDHPALGRLLIFDPTDPDTPLGYLPEYEQDSLAVLMAESGGLARMPVIPPSANRQERQTEIVLAADGSIHGEIKECYSGQAAGAARRQVRRRSEQDYRREIEAWLTRGAKGAAVSSITPADNGAQFRLAVEFAAPAYAQSMQNRMLVFKPAVIAHRNLPAFSASSRKYPVVLNSEGFTDTVRIRIPDGFKVDEKPEDVNLKTSFATYRMTLEPRAGALVLTRALEMHAAVIKPEQYAKLRDFFRRIASAEEGLVVLVKE